MRAAPKIGIDLGTVNFRTISARFDTPFVDSSALVRDAVSGQIKAVGQAAKNHELSSGEELVQPVSSGVINDYQGATSLLEYAIKNTVGWWNIFKPTVVMARSLQVSPAIVQLTRQAVTAAGAGSIYWASTPVLAALGTGIEPTDSSGVFLVDIGGGTTEAAIVASGNCVVSSSTGVGGEDCTAAIASYLLNDYSLIVSDQTAQELKHDIATALERDTEQTKQVGGQNVDTRETTTVTISSNELVSVLSEPLKKMADTAATVLESTPPALLSDVAESGVVLVGGGAKLKYFDNYLSRRLSIPVEVRQQPEEAIISGCQRAFSYTQVYQQTVPKTNLA